MAMQLKHLAALSLLHCADALAPPQIWVQTSSLPLLSGGAEALAPLRGKIGTTLPLLRGVGAAPRGTATLGAAAVLPYRAESFGVFVPDDDPKEPERAKDCPEYVKAEECRAAGCEWTKKTAVCAHWALKNSMGQPKPPPETLTPTNSPTEPDPTDAPTETPTVATGTPSSSPTPPPPSPTGATSTTAAVEPASTTAADEEPETTTTTKVTSTTAADEEASTSTTAEQTTTSTTAAQTTTTTTAEQTTTTTTCFIPKAATYGPSGCIVVACNFGFKPNGDGSACDACDVENATSYSSNCTVTGCDDPLLLSGNKCVECTSDDHCETGHVCHEEKCAAMCSAGWRAAKGWRECKDGCPAQVDSSFIDNLTAWFELSLSLIHI